MDYVYTVKEGDKPSIIAQRLVGDGNRWTELMYHNTVLTPNQWIRYSNKIVPVYNLRIGQQLNIPSHWIKNIPNQLIHTMQGFIGSSDSNNRLGFIGDDNSLTNPIPTIQCNSGESADDCGKRVWKTALQDACVAVSIEATSGGASVDEGTVSDLCAVLAGPIADITYKPLKDIVNFVGSAIQNAIMSIIPDGWKAHGVSSPALVPALIWTTANISGAYQKAIDTVQSAWDQARISQGLNPAPLAIQARFLLPQSSSDQLDPNNWPSGIPGNADGPLKIRLAQNTPTFLCAGAENCLLFWLYTYIQGWSTQTRANYGDGWAVTTTRPGAVNDALNQPWNNDGSGLVPQPQGNGPFGLDLAGWSSDLSEGQMNYLGQSVQFIWSWRLAALQKALPEVISRSCGSSCFRKNGRIISC